MKIINPATEQVITELEADSSKLIHNIYHSAIEAQPIWADKSLEERLATIRAFDQLLEKNKQSLAITLTNETGKPLWQAINEINGARGRISYFLDHAKSWLSEEVITEENGLTEKIAYEPLGIIGNISAWNYPYLVGVNVFIPALIAGNAVMYKPSEYAALTGLKIEAMMHEAGVPQHVFQTVTGDKEAGEIMLTLPLDGYFFTGSHKTGQYIYEKVAKKMVPCQMELGGKDPLYVNADNADIKAVAAAAAEGAFYNAGQSCCAVERIYVHELVYEDFLEAFVEEVKQMKVGDPMDKDTYIGPMTQVGQVDFLQNQAGRALLKGARIIYGEDRWEGKGNYFLPTILVDVDHSMRIMKEESFGPLIGVQKVSGDEEAIQLMQDTDYGLTAAVYSDHYESAEPVLKAMRSGSVYWNCCDRVSATLPWSGRGNSGIGSTLSYQGIRAFVQPKAYHLRG